MRASAVVVVVDWILSSLLTGADLLDVRCSDAKFAVGIMKGLRQQGVNAPNGS